ncbi:prolyl aminopeptidase [Clostridiales bacterium COT073_COT-073]|nr:prolyl aminopeptidase [Clostridiales bacterium COT073_COT-073]
MTIQEYFKIKTNYYPEIEPFASGYLPVSDIHQIYYEEVGNPNGKPILFLHGGPGGQIKTYHRRYFDPQHYHIILFDQRGAGKSKPYAELKENTTQDLVADIEKLREYVGVDKWHVFGGSWGSTLALVYAIMHPDRVTGLLLRGIFLGRQEDIDWSFQKGVDAFYPEEYQAYLAPLSEEDRKNHNVVAGYYQLLTSENKDIREKAAKAWSLWEGSLITLLPDKQVLSEFAEPELAVALARLECHYFINQMFLPENYILNNTDKIADIPAIIVHGRYDMDCRLSSAYQLHQKLPKSELRIIEASGHSASEPKVGEALIESADAARLWE